MFQRLNAPMTKKDFHVKELRQLPEFVDLPIE
jgi:hypothetical protein